MGDRCCANCPHPLRRVVVWDEKNEREIVLLTNHLTFGANILSSIYKRGHGDAVKLLNFLQHIEASSYSSYRFQPKARIGNISGR